MDTNTTKVKNGTIVYCGYEKGVIEGEVRENWLVSVNVGAVTRSTDIGSIFLPTDFIKDTSTMVAAEREKFNETKCFGSNVNPDIYSLFEEHWINMCNAEFNTEQYAKEKQRFEAFIKELMDVTEATNKVSVSGLPYLRR
ncbi:MAG: hypothetical protein WCG98_06865 [bacterium]